MPDATVTPAAPAPAAAAPAAAAPAAPSAPVTPAAPAAQAPATPAAPAAQPAKPEAPKTLLDEVAPANAEIKYDLKLPKDSLLAQADLDEMLAFAKENKVPADLAQKMVERQSEAKAQYQAANKPGGVEWTKRVEAFEKEALMDPDLGAGDPAKLKGIAEQGRRVLDKYFPPQVKDFLRESGLGSNRWVLKGFAALAKASSNDTLVVPQPAAGAPAQAEFDLKAMYPDVKR